LPSKKNKKYQNKSMSSTLAPDTTATYAPPHPPLCPCLCKYWVAYPPSQTIA
jgi:hypothetical protein